MFNKTPRYSCGTEKDFERDLNQLKLLRHIHAEIVFILSRYLFLKTHFSCVTSLDRHGILRPSQTVR